MDNLIAVRTNCYKGFDFEQAVNGIKNAGFKYVELSASLNNSLHINRNESKDRLKYCKDRLKEAGLVPIALGGHTNLMDENNLDDFIKNIKLAKYFNCKYIVSSIGDPHKTENYTVENDIIVNNIKNIVPYLKEYDVDLVIELHGKYSTGKIVKQICKLVRSKNVRINYDTGNAVYYNKFDNAELLNDITNSVDYISYMHLKDKLGKKNEWNFPALGKGYIPLTQIFDILTNKKKNIPLAVEIEFTEKGVKNVKEVDEALISSANYLKSLGFNLQKKTS